MKAINKIVKSKYYSIPINIIIILSIAFIVLEKFIFINAKLHRYFMYIDIAIVLIFSIDFILRFLGGGINYFLKNYGWVDLLACVPGLNPAIKGFSFLRVFRTLRFMRVTRIVKLFKSAQIGFSKVKQDMFLLISTLLIIFLITGGGIFIFSMSNILRERDNANELLIMEKAKIYKSRKAKKEFFELQPEVEKVIAIKDLKTDETTFWTTIFRRNIKYTELIPPYFVVFSRKSSVIQLQRYEGFLILGIFFMTIVILVVFSIQFEISIMKQIREANKILRKKLGIEEYELSINEFEELETLVNKLK